MMTELEFGERLRQFRKAKNMTQQELADQLGVSNKSVSRWESGSYPDVATLGPLSKALGVTVDDLLGEAPSLRTLGRADWQNLLSFAFALGGGVLFFLLDLFTPTLVCYLLYLCAMAYGVHLQKHYTFHSKWFHRANLAINFFVNLQLLSAILSSLLSLLAGVFFVQSQLLTALAERQLSGVPLRELAGAEALFLMLAGGMTVITWHTIRKSFELSGPLFSFKPRPIRLRRSRCTVSKALPVLCPVLLALFWCLYLSPVPLPACFYTKQASIHNALWLVLTALVLLVLLVRKRWGMLLPAGITVLACRAYTGLLNWDWAYSPYRNCPVPDNGVLNPTMYPNFGRPTWGLLLLAAALVLFYLLCCFVRLDFSEPNAS